jgi:hypothetical protein
MQDKTKDRLRALLESTFAHLFLVLRVVVVGCVVNDSKIRRKSRVTVALERFTRLGNLLLPLNNLLERRGLLCTWKIV